MSDPLQSGLAAGQAAYSGAAPKRMGISAADLSSVRGDVTSGLQSAAAQRQVLNTNAAKQAAGQYTNNGTSAAMYNYLKGQGGYPVNAVPSGQPVNTGTTGYGGSTSTLPGLTKTTGPIQKPYETNVNTGNPTQTKIATDAVTNPTKMGKVTQSSVTMPKPSAMQQLIGIAGPAYLGYNILEKTGGLNALNGIGTAYNNFMYPTGVYGADGSLLATDPASYFAPNNLIDTYYTNPSIQLADAGNESALQYLADQEAARVAAEQAAAAAAAEQAAAAAAAEQAAAGAGLTEAAGAGAGLTEAAGAGAGAGLTEAAGAGAGLTEAAGAAGAGEAGAAAGLTEAAANDAAAAELGFGDYAAMTAEYGPEIAAVLIVDHLTGGHLASGIGDAVSGVGGALSDAASDIGSGISNAGNKVASWFGWADGGQVKHYADGGISAAQGISVGSRYDPNIDGISQAAPDVSFQPTVGRFAQGGISHLGGYSDGGRLLRGPGDGVSDSIPATIGGKQPARLADGEFVVPARIVSELGNGSTEAGARKLYAMMDRVQAARGKTVGKGKIAKNTRADKYLPK